MFKADCCLVTDVCDLVRLLDHLKDMEFLAPGDRAAIDQLDADAKMLDPSKADNILHSTELVVSKYTTI